MAPPTAFFAGASGGASFAAASRLAVLLRRIFPTYAPFSSAAIPRHFSSSIAADPPPDSEPPEETPPRHSPAARIKPVSYDAKPGAESPAADLEDHPEISPRRPPADRRVEPRSEAVAEPGKRAWTREEVRYMKAAPAVSPVSYPARVAPLPEDRVEKGEEGEDDVKKNEQLATERRRIEMDARLRTLPKVEEESVPYPTLIKVEKKQQKVALDLQEAIREVKVSRLQSVLEINPFRPL